MSDKFHKAKVIEPETFNSHGTQLYLDGIKVKGLVSLRYELRATEVRHLVVDILVENVEFEVQAGGLKSLES